MSYSLLLRPYAAPPPPRAALTLAALYCYRLTITASCPMNLQYFPMDRQLCHIEIESCEYPFRDWTYRSILIYSTP